MKRRISLAICVLLIIVSGAAVADDTVTLDTLVKLKAELEAAQATLEETKTWCEREISLLSLTTGVYICGDGDLEPGYYVVRPNARTDSRNGCKISIWETETDEAAWGSETVGPGRTFTFPLKEGWKLKITGDADIEKLKGEISADIRASEYASLVEINGIVSDALAAVNQAIAGTQANAAHNGVLLKPGIYICGSDTIPAGTYLFTMTKADENTSPRMEIRTNGMNGGTFMLTEAAPQVVITVNDGDPLGVKNCEGYLTKFGF